MAAIRRPVINLEGTEALGADDLIRDVDRLAVIHDRESVPLTTWLTHTAGRMEQTMNEDFWWQESQFDVVRNTIAAGLTGGAATESGVVIDSPEYVIGDTFAHPESGQYFIVEDAERVFDNTLPTGGYSTITIRGIGGNVQAVSSSMVVAPCGIALADGAFYAEAKGIIPTQFFGTTTTRTQSVEVSIGADAATTYFGSPRQMSNQKQLTILRKNMERDLLNSPYAVMTNYTQANPNGTRTGATIRFTRGLTKSIISKTQTYSGDLTEDTWDEFLLTKMYADDFYGSNNKLAFFGPTAMDKLVRQLKAKSMIRQLGGPGVTAYGLQILNYKTSGGRNIMLFEERNFKGMSPYEKGVMLLDQNFIKLRHIGANIMDIEDTSLPRQRARSLAVTTQYGLELQFESSCAFLKQAS